MPVKSTAMLHLLPSANREDHIPQHTHSNSGTVTQTYCI